MLWECFKTHSSSLSLPPLHTSTSGGRAVSRLSSSQCAWAPSCQCCSRACFVQKSTTFLVKLQVMRRRQPPPVPTQMCERVGGNYHFFHVMVGTNFGLLFAVTSPTIAGEPLFPSILTCEKISFGRVPKLGIVQN